MRRDGLPNKRLPISTTKRYDGFNNRTYQIQADGEQKADGRIISMRWKPVGVTSNSGRGGFAAPSAQESFNGRREQADQQRRLNRRADPTVQDGSYGFGAQNDQTYGRDGGRNNRRSRAQGGRDAYQDAQDYGLYSDQMMVDAPSQDSRRGGKWHR